MSRIVSFSFLYVLSGILFLPTGALRQTPSYSHTIIAEASPSVSGYTLQHQDYTLSGTLVDGDCPEEEEDEDKSSARKRVETALPATCENILNNLAAAKAAPCSVLRAFIIPSPDLYLLNRALLI